MDTINGIVSFWVFDGIIIKELFYLPQIHHITHYTFNIPMRRRNMIKMVCADTMGFSRNESAVYCVHWISVDEYNFGVIDLFQRELSV